MAPSDKIRPTLRQHAQKVRSKILDPSGTIAQEVYRKNVELARTNHTLSLLRTIDSLVLETENTLDDLAKGIARALVDNSNYLFSAIFIKSSLHSTQPMRLSGFGALPNPDQKMPAEETLMGIQLHSDPQWLEAKEYTRIIDLSAADTGEVSKFFPTDSSLMHDLANGLGVRSLCLVKLIARKKLVGALLVGLSATASELNLNEIEYLGRIGEAAGLAIDNKLLFEENQQVLKELKKSNEKLKALDEAKDEFISMASHQLRTPLTAVKGYVSMVIEGDAGPIAKAQKDLLEQAFASSQRMVYLIADLLNVSRLKTGKFVIESAPTHLPEVVESEIGQLIETAKVHKLELTYVKPENFPTIDLDETKTRQVIMNFIDNSIYYTPAGGHIRVELTSNDKSVEFKVIDDGLGVPKAEQPHLFTKFYRAGNAKKARPDGTGLGLFMAKKVIVAQGGSLIFTSEEGKGSTFGFSFPLAGMQASAATTTDPAPQV